MQGKQNPEIAQRGPFVMEMDPGTYYWCACGRSKSQPFCDGSHKGTGIVPVAHQVSSKIKVAWCGCKHSKRGCVCDGSHKSVS